jgi:hypothetical protein
LSILIFYILLCWKYLPVSEAGPSPWGSRKIPEDPQIKNVRKNCRRFTAWGGKGKGKFSAKSGTTEVV